MVNKSDDDKARIHKHLSSSFRFLMIVCHFKEEDKIHLPYNGGTNKESS